MERAGDFFDMDAGIDFAAFDLADQSFTPVNRFPELRHAHGRAFSFAGLSDAVADFGPAIEFLRADIELSGHRALPLAVTLTSFRI